MAWSINTIRRIAIASIVLQVIVPLFLAWSLVGALGLVSDLLQDAETLMEQDSVVALDEVERRLYERSEAVFRARPVLILAIIGGILSWVTIRKLAFHETWFLKASRIYGWLWMLLIPVGTVIGILILSARRAALELAESAASKEKDG